jgi:CheY-like chemotaxis protein
MAFSVETAESGEIGIKMIKKAIELNSPYQLVRMDWKMPGMDVVSTVKQIEATDSLEHIPTVLMVTSYSKDDLIHKIKDSNIHAEWISPKKPNIL